VGKQMSKLEDTQTYFNKIKEEIPSDRFFELGENQEILANIRSNFDNLQKKLSDLDLYYSSVPFKDRGGYYEAKRVTSIIQIFLDEVRLSAVGDVDKTRKFMEYVHELDSVFNMQSTKPAIIQSSETDQEKRFPTQSQEPATNLVQITRERNSFSQDQAHVSKAKRRGLDNFTNKFNKNTITPLGELFFDVIGRKPQSSTSPIILGWVLFISILFIIIFVTTFVILLLNGTIRIEQLIQIWQFFFPAKE
jgi:hypothetical protein